MTENTIRKSAIFVDFDNAFLSLRGGLGSTSHEATIFAENPLYWMDWLARFDQEQNDEIQRRFLVRRCYLNPKSFGMYRANFVTAGFDIVDCPSLTAAGKNSADIRIVLDVMGFIDDDRCPVEEVFVMSADTDFAPLLIKLRQRDLQTVVVATGQTTPVYRNSCDLLIDVDDFIENALQAAEKLDEEKETVSGIQTIDEQKDSRIKPIIKECREYIISLATDKPIYLANLAKKVKEQFPDIAESRWSDFGSFMEMLESMDLSPLEIENRYQGGILYDPQKHDIKQFSHHILSESQSGEFKKNHPDIAPLAEKTSGISGIPCLTPEHYHVVFKVISKIFNEEGYQGGASASKIRASLVEEYVPINRKEVNFILRCIWFTGYRFTKGEEKPEILAEKFFENFLALCGRSQYYPERNETDLLKRWLVGNTSNTYNESSS